MLGDLTCNSKSVSQSVSQSVSELCLLLRSQWRPRPGPCRRPAVSNEITGRTHPQLDTFEAGVSIDRHVLQDVVLSLGAQATVAISPTLMEDI